MILESIRHWYLRRVAATALRTIGYDAAVALAERLADGVFRLDTPSRRRAESRLRRALARGNLSPIVDPHDGSSVTDVVRAMYCHAGRFWIEALYLDRLLRPSTWRRAVHMPNEPVIEELGATRRGCVFAATFHGNPAVCAYVLGRYFQPIHVVVDYLPQPVLRSWQGALYDQPWLRPVTRAQAAQVLPEVLSRGGGVMILCGTDSPSRSAVEVDFLGDRIRCPLTVGRLARWFGSSVAAVTCMRVPGRRFGFQFDVHRVATAGAADEGDGRVVADAMAALEHQVMQSPAQFGWLLPSGAIGTRPHSTLIASSRFGSGITVARGGEGRTVPIAVAQA